MKSKKGFTLVELLAVIAILAILVILALPNVINRFNEAKKQTFITEAKKIYTEAGKKFVSSSISGTPVKVISSEDNSKLDMTGKKLKYCIVLDNRGNVSSIKVSNGQWIASLVDGKEFEDLTIDDLEEGNLDDYDCGGNTPDTPETLNCVFDGELVQGAEYVNGPYTYRYMQEGDSYKEITWKDITTEGWGVQLTDRTSTEAINSSPCTMIKGKPIVSMAYMFASSQASSLDLSNFNTSNVINMEAMFNSSKATSLDLSSFDTSNVTNMLGMFKSSQALSFNLSSFDTHNVVDMSLMFGSTQATTIDISNFDTSNVTQMPSMFNSSAIKEIIGITNLNTSKVINMTAMFLRCKVPVLDLSSFDTRNVYNMSVMFYESPDLEKIYVSDSFDISNVTQSSMIFYGDTNLVGGAGTVYAEKNYEIDYAHIDGGTSNPGYFTLKQ